MRARSTDCEVCLAVDREPARGAFIADFEGWPLLCCEPHFDAWARLDRYRTEQSRPQRTAAVVNEYGRVQEEIVA